MSRGISIAVLCLAVSACAPEPQPDPAPSAWAVEVANEDPAFAGRPFLDHWLDTSPQIAWSEKGDETDRGNALFGMITPEHERAVRRVQELVPKESLARDALAFLRSPAGQAAVRAERLALVGFAQTGEGLALGVSEWLCDPERVGASARAKFEHTRDAVYGSSSASVSPQALSWVVAAMTLEPEQAQQIRDFYTSESGKQWLDVRCAAQDYSRKSQRRIMDRLRADGWAGSIYDELDQFLPKAKGSRSGK